MTFSFKAFVSALVLVASISFSSQAFADSYACANAKQETADSLGRLIDQFKVCYKLVTNGGSKEEIANAMQESRNRRTTVEHNIGECFYQCMSPGTCADVKNTLEDDDYGNTEKEAIPCWGQQQSK